MEFNLLTFILSSYLILNQIESFVVFCKINDNNNFTAVVSTNIYSTSGNYNAITLNNSQEEITEEVEFSPPTTFENYQSNEIIEPLSLLSLESIEFNSNENLSEEATNVNVTVAAASATATIASTSLSTVNYHDWNTIENSNRHSVGILAEFSKLKRQTTRSIYNGIDTNTKISNELLNGKSPPPPLPPELQLSSLSLPAITITENNIYSSTTESNDSTNVMNTIIRNLIGTASAWTSSALATMSTSTTGQEVKVNTTGVWPVKHASVVEGDVVLGGLMMVHSREDSITCGPIMPQGGIQALEAMLYTLDRINEIQLLPNITLGAHILDDCDKDTYGLEMAVDFIKGSISNIDDAEYHCNKTTVRKVISGVVGAASSVTSIQVANLLRLFRIPQVSFFSTSPELSNKQRFEYFSRTIPSDHYQVKAMVEIVKRMGWSYISIIYEESNYGIKAYEELEELLAKHNICIAVKEKLVKDSGVAEEIAYDNIVQKLLTKPRARGVCRIGQ